MSDPNTNLYPLPNSWKWTILAELVEIVSGGTPSTKIPEYWGGDISWITPADLSNYKEKYISYGAKSITQEGLDTQVSHPLLRAYG